MTSLMMHKSSRSRRTGFTLIELLVVIAIIAILAAILFPVFAQARAKARQISCISNMKQIALGMQMYQQDYDEIYPLEEADNSSAVYSYDITWVNGIQPYVKNTQLFVCPDFITSIDPSVAKATSVPKDSGPIASINTYGAVGGPIVSYGMPPTQEAYVLGNNPGGQNPSYPYSSLNATPPYNIPASTRWQGIGGFANSSNADHCQVGSVVNISSLANAQIARPAEEVLVEEGTRWDEGACRGAVGGNAIPRHFFQGYFNAGYQGIINLAFCDGHAKTYQPSQLWQVTPDAGGNFFTHYWPYK